MNACVVVRVESSFCWLVMDESHPTTSHCICAILVDCALRHGVCVRVEGGEGVVGDGVALCGVVVQMYAQNEKKACEIATAQCVP